MLSREDKLRVREMIQKASFTEILDINHFIEKRVSTLEERSPLEFRVGANVQYPSSAGEIRTGKVVKINRKSVKIMAEEFGEQPVRMDPRQLELVTD